MRAVVEYKSTLAVAFPFNTPRRREHATPLFSSSTNLLVLPPGPSATRDAATQRAAPALLPRAAASGPFGQPAPGAPGSRCFSPA